MLEHKTGPEEVNMLGKRLAVGKRGLAPFTEVRILVPQPTTYSYHSASPFKEVTANLYGETGMKRRNPIWAGVLSLLTPGLGQIYNGQFTKGVIFYISLNILILFVGLSGVLFNFWGLIIFVVAPIVLSVAIIVEAVMTSRKLGSIALQRYNRWYVYVLSIVIAGVLNNFVWSKPILGRVKSYSMPAGSMEPAVKRGDHMIASMSYYTSNKPKQSDIVIFRFPSDHSKDFIKRVVAVEGQELEIRDKKVFVDGKEVAEPWAIHRSPETTPATQSPRDNLGPIIVPPGHVFVLGDNRDFSLDSRFFGPVDVREIKGRVLYIYWADDIRRIGTSVH